MTAPSPLGRLFLVPAPLDFGCAEPVPLTDVMPLGTLRDTARLTSWIAENAKTTRAYLKRVNAVAPLALPLQAQQIVELPHAVHKKGDHQVGGGFDAKALLAPALLGHDIGLVSEAGMPAIADPGSSVVRAAHDMGLTVVPLVGPVSLLLALAASGLNGQNFAFTGYLPQEPAARALAAKQLETLALKSGQAQIVIETPYRNAALLQGLLEVLSPNTRLAVSCGLTLPQARSRSQTVKAWRESAPFDFGGQPAVFAIGR